MSLLRILFSSCLLLAMLFASSTSHAIVCSAPDGSSRFTEAIGQTVALPTSTPPGTILWQSSKTLRVVCRRDPIYSLDENIFLYTDPAIAKSRLNGVEFGIEYKGTQYWNVDRIDTGLNFSPAAGQMTYAISFKVILRTTQSFVAGPISGTDSFDVFMVDGVGGLNPGSSNFRYAVSGLSNIRFVSCSATASVTPATVDFGSIPLSRTRSSGASLVERPFVINLNKTCNAAFTVNSTFTSNNGYADTQATLMKAIKSSDQSDSGLAISLYVNGSANPLTYGAKTPIGVMQAADRTVQVPMTARLVAANPALVTVGAFRGLLVFTLSIQ